MTTHSSDDTPSRAATDPRDEIDEQTEIALRASEQYFRLLVEEIQDYAIFILDPAGRIVSWSQGAEAITGYSQAEVLGAHFSLFRIPADVQRRHPAHGLEVARRVGRFEDEGWRVRKDGSRFWANVVITAIRDDKGKLIGFGTVTRDLTERRQTEEALNAQRSFLRSVIDTDPNLIFAKDWNGRFTLANRAVAAIYGTTPEELVGKTDADFNPDSKEVEHFLRDDREVMESGRSKLIPEEPVTHPETGETRWFQTRKVPLTLADGMRQVLGVSTDITERLRAEGALRKSEEWYRSLVKATAAIVWNTPPSGAMEWEQPEWSAFTGQSWEEYRGSGWLAAVHAEDRVKAAEGWSVATERGSLYEIELRLRARHGEYRHMQVRAVPIREVNGRIREWVGIHFDVTDQVRAREELERLYQEVTEASRAKTKFLATVSHELRTPLTAIIGYAELLKLGVPEPIPTQASSQVDRINRSAQHLLELIEEILTFGRMETGRETMQLEAMHLRALMEEVREVIEPLAAEQGLEFRMRTPAKPVVLRTDSGKVRQILLNVLGNAVRFTREGGIELRSRVGATSIVFEIEDTGIGIAAEHLDQIFEPFWQVDQGSTREAQGTGLGLSIARRTARMLGGELSVQSRPGAGTTFTLRLPLSVRNESSSRDLAATPGPAAS
jgi:PAS domain S-box-containing protein